MYSYTCTYASEPSPSSGTNTATAAWSDVANSGTQTGTATFDFGTATPTFVDGSVSVTDTLGGILGTVSYTDPSPTTFTYSHTFPADPAGTCTSHYNTATFTTDTTGTTGSASQTVTDCQGADLTVSKTATPAFTRTYSWSVVKYCDSPTDSKSSCVITTSSIPFNVVVTNTGFTDSGWKVTGTITVHNPNDWESVTLTGVTDSVDDGGVCVVSGNTGQTIPASGDSIGLTYVCTYASAPSPSSGTNTATATWDATAASTPSGSASGTAGFDFGSVSPATVNASVTVKDTFQGVTNTLGTCTVATSPCTFPDTRTITLPTAGCQSFTNSAAVYGDGNVKLGTASSTATACPPGFVTNTSFCAINQNTVNLIYVQDGTSTFGLKASKPGQFYYNVFYTATPGSSFTITINLPYPFITQGAHPIQTSSSFSPNTGGLCISPSFDNPVTGITATGNHFSSSGYPVVLLSDSGSSPTITVTVTGNVPASGLVYITVHMDYGLKGFDFTKGVSQTFMGYTSNAAVGSNTPIPSYTINNGQSYLFSTGGSLVSSFTLNSINTFKADPGFAGIVTDKNGNPIAGAKVVVTFNGKTYTAYSDSTGYWSVVYKYTGSPTSWKVTVTYNGVTLTYSGMINSNKLLYIGSTF